MSSAAPSGARGKRPRGYEPRAFPNGMFRDRVMGSIAALVAPLFAERSDETGQRPPPNGRTDRVLEDESASGFEKGDA